jgi:hypothetical protein
MIFIQANKVRETWKGKPVATYVGPGLSCSRSTWRWGFTSYYSGLYPTPCCLGINDSEEHDTRTASIFNYERRVVRLFNSTPRHEDVPRSDDTSPSILNLDIRWKWSVSRTIRCTPEERFVGNHSIWCWLGPRASLKAVGKLKSLS